MHMGEKICSGISSKIYTRPLPRGLAIFLFAIEYSMANRKIAYTLGRGWAYISDMSSTSGSMGAKYFQEFGPRFLARHVPNLACHGVSISCVSINSVSCHVIILRVSVSVPCQGHLGLPKMPTIETCKKTGANVVENILECVPKQLVTHQSCIKSSAAKAVGGSWFVGTSRSALLESMLWVEAT